MNTIEYWIRKFTHTFGSRENEIENLIYLTERDNRRLKKIMKEVKKTQNSTTLRPHLRNRYVFILEMEYNYLMKKQNNRVKRMKQLAKHAQRKNYASQRCR